MAGLMVNSCGVTSHLEMIYIKWDNTKTYYLDY